MKIRGVKANNRRKALEVETVKGVFLYPYAKLEKQPGKRNRIEKVEVDQELGREAFTYVLASGAEGTVHIDHVLEYNRDPRFLRELLLYKLTIEAQQRIESSSLSKRELIRRLGTSATQFYRLLDQTNYRKSLGQLLTILHILDCDVDVIVREKAAESA